MLFAAAWTAATLWVCAPYLRAAARDVASLAFVAAEARVVRSGVREVEGQQRFVIEYRYRVDGIEYTGLRRYPTPGMFQRGEDLDGVTRRYAPGARITIAVNPFEAEDAVITPGIRATTLYGLLWVVPGLLAAFGMCRVVLHELRGARDGQIAPAARAWRSPNGDWVLRVMRLPPWVQGVMALALGSLAGGLLLGPFGGRPDLWAVALTWAAVLAVAAAVAFTARRRLLSGGYDWRYAASRAELRAPDGRVVPRMRITGVGLASSVRRDSDGDEHVAVVRLDLGAGESLEVVRAASRVGADAAALEVRPVAQFLEEALGLGAGVRA